MDLWKIGVRVEANEDGLVSKEEIEGCILAVMEGNRCKEIKSNAETLKNLVKETIEDGGSSSRNIDEFVDELKN